MIFLLMWLESNLGLTNYLHSLLTNVVGGDKTTVVILFWEQLYNSVGLQCCSTSVSKPNLGFKVFLFSVEHLINKFILRKGLTKNKFSNICAQIINWKIACSEWLRSIVIRKPPDKFWDLKLNVFKLKHYFGCLQNQLLFSAIALWSNQKEVMRDRYWLNCGKSYEIEHIQSDRF